MLAAERMPRQNMAEELKIVNESGNALANRLENLASHTRVHSSQAISSLEDDAPEREENIDYSFGRDKEDIPSFFIKDTDYMDRDDDADEGETFASKAEQELYEAIQKNKKQKIKE